MKKILVFMILSLCFFTAQAAELSPISLYYRCYAHLTRARPLANDPRIAQIVSGQLTYIDACMQVFDLGKLNQNSGELITRTPESIRVLENFNRFHISWFDDVNVFNALIPGGENINHFVHDGTEGALHFTRALFFPNAQFKEAITSSDTYQAIRSKGYATFGIWPTTQLRADKWGSKDVHVYIGSGGTKVEKTLASVLDPNSNQNGLHIQMGQIVGIEPMKSVNITDQVFYDANWTRPTVGVPADVTKSFGAGVIGTQPYIMINRVREASKNEDGGLRSGRIWSKQVFREILCRDIPVVQQKDAVALVDQTGTNPFPFRNSSSCMQCHSSIDPLAWSIRDIRLNINGDGFTTFLNRFYFLEKYNKAYMSQENGPVHGLGAGTVADSNFFKRPPKGHLYFRTYEGKLVSEQVQGLDGADGLGEAIANLDDYYVCASKRYFEFFTGHKVIIEDITDPLARKLNDKEKRLRSFSISLGKKLRQTQNMRDIVKDIISSDFYKSSDYEIKY